MQERSTSHNRSSPAGRLLVLVPNANYIGISKKIWDKFERRRLKKVAQRLRVQNVGVIIRTVAEGKSEQHIENDFNQLINNWNKIENKADHESAPALVMRIWKQHLV